MAIPLLPSLSPDEPARWNEAAALTAAGLRPPAGLDLRDLIDAAAPRGTLSPNAQVVLARRYLKKDDAGRAIETADEMFARVAHAIAAPDARRGDHPAASARSLFQRI